MFKYILSKPRVFKNMPYIQVYISICQNSKWVSKFIYQLVKTVNGYQMLLCMKNTYSVALKFKPILWKLENYISLNYSPRNIKIIFH